jgi:hypothetical protein
MTDLRLIQCRKHLFDAYVLNLLGEGVAVLTGALGARAHVAVRDPLGRSTPQDSIFHYLEACQTRDYSKALPGSGGSVSASVRSSASPLATVFWELVECAGINRRGVHKYFAAQYPACRCPCQRFDGSRLQPFMDETVDPRVGHAMLDKPLRPLVAHVIEGSIVSSRCR